jgi:hypothetical protein
MQVTCFGFKWDEVKKRKSAQQIVDEMILTDDIDLYSVPLPEEIWKSDSGSQHFATIEALEEFSETPEASEYPGLDDVRRLLANGPSIDELGISELTDDCYYVSMSPATVAKMAGVFRALELDRLAEDAQTDDLPAEELEEWLRQWKDALAFAASQKLGLIGHCG